MTIRAARGPTDRYRSFAPHGRPGFDAMQIRDCRSTARLALHRARMVRPSRFGTPARRPPDGNRDGVEVRPCSIDRSVSSALPE